MDFKIFIKAGISIPVFIFVIEYEIYIYLMIQFYIILMMHLYDANYDKEIIEVQTRRVYYVVNQCKLSDTIKQKEILH